MTGRDRHPRNDEPGSPAVNVHAIVERSRANGPGERSVIWFQGCSLACPGCFNPATHSSEARRVTPVTRVVEEIVARETTIEGITVSGGEPFQQPIALDALCARIRRDSALSVLVFTGYTLREIERDPVKARCLAHIDVLIAGRYVARRHVAAALIGSANQKIHLLTERYRLEELRCVPVAEAFIERDGGVLLTGIRPPTLG